MKLAIISFTSAGSLLNYRIKKLLASIHHCTCYYKGKTMQKEELIEVTHGLQEWCKTIFSSVDGIVFIGAVGIAVRTIAPFVKDKTKDPLVLVIDEKANFVISLLSGHIGGGNELSLTLSELLCATPVITTATDINEKFAVDVFAKKNILHITDWKKAKEISASILEGKKIGLLSKLPIEGKIPDELVLVQDKKEDALEEGICISLNENEKPFRSTLNLVPKTVIIGIGCKKDTSPERLESFLLRTLEKQNICLSAIKCIASIDLKAKEACILAFVNKYKLPFVTYSAKELAEVAGEFQESEFVKQITGVGNVCERAAIKSCKSGILLLKKQAYEGMTLAFAREKEMGGIRFE